MKFQAGDHVLWWGKRVLVRKARTYGYFNIEVSLEDGTTIWTTAKELAPHQRPWAYDKKLNGWVPA